MYNIPFYVMDNVVRCECGYDKKRRGDSGESVGLAQIHLPDHQNSNECITEEMALDTDFALSYMEKMISTGHGNMWTCYRSLFPDGYK